MNVRPIEQHRAVAVLAGVRGDRAEAARRLGICRRTLDMKLWGWGIADLWRREPGPVPRSIGREAVYRRKYRARRREMKNGVAA